MEELLHILCNCNISPERKRPFAQFLINVYFNTDEEDDHSEICSLTTDLSVHASFIICLGVNHIVDIFFNSVKCGVIWSTYQFWWKTLGLHYRPSQIQSTRRYVMHSCPSAGAHLRRSRQLKYQQFAQLHVPLSMLLRMVVNSSQVSRCMRISISLNGVLGHCTTDIQ